MHRTMRMIIAWFRIKAYGIFMPPVYFIIYCAILCYNINLEFLRRYIGFRKCALSHVLRHRCGTRVWYAELGVGSMCIPIPWQIRGNYDCEFNHWYYYIWIYIMGFNSSPPGQNCLHFAHVVFRCIFVNEKVCILNKISLRFVPKAPIHNNPAQLYRRQAIIWTNADSTNRHQGEMS